MSVAGTIRPPKESERYFALLRVDAINGEDPQHLNELKDFDDLTPLHPTSVSSWRTPGDDGNFEMRIVDLVAPRRQGPAWADRPRRPRTGKTVLLQKMAKSLITNYPNCKVIVLLIDERPEEVTDFKANTPPDVEVVASTFDENTTRHVQVCEMCIEKSRRLVEYGHDVIILMDLGSPAWPAPTTPRCPTRARSSPAASTPTPCNAPRSSSAAPGRSRTAAASPSSPPRWSTPVQKPTTSSSRSSRAPVTPSCTSTADWSRSASTPRSTLAASGTRREELLMDAMELKLVYRLRKVLADMNVVEAMELLKSRMLKTPTNAEFLMSMGKE